MTEISADRLFAFYRDAIERCAQTASLSDEGIEYNLYEEFDVAATSFLHDESLARLFSARLIDERAVATSQEIRRLWTEIQNSSWTTDEIRTNSRWRHLFSLCNELLTRLPAVED